MSIPQEDKVILEMTLDESNQLVKTFTARINQLAKQPKTPEIYHEVFVLDSLVARIDPQMRELAMKETLLEALKLERKEKP